MEKEDVEPHHLVFSVASIFVAGLITIFFKPSSLGVNSWGSLIFYTVMLFVFVRLGVVLLTILLFNIINKNSQYKAKNALGKGDFNLTSSVIIAGFLVLEIYLFLIEKFPKITDDYLNIVGIIFGLSVGLFYMSYYVSKLISELWAF